MELGIPLAVVVLLCAGGGLLVALLVAIPFLIKLGVFARYATRQQEPDQGEYSLDDSHEASK